MRSVHSLTPTLPHDNNLACATSEKTAPPRPPPGFEHIQPRPQYSRPTTSTYVNGGNATYATKSFGQQPAESVQKNRRTNFFQAATHIMRNAVGQRTSHRKYSHAANSLLATINFNLEDIRNWAILDSGATSHFLVPDAPTINVQPALNPLHVTMPDGNSVSSTHTCELDLPQLPKQARLGHIIPGLSKHSLLSVIKLCNAEC